MFDDELLANIVKVSFAHTLESIPYISLNELLLSLCQRWEMVSILDVQLVAG